jgi:hypothetical protein
MASERDDIRIVLDPEDEFNHDPGTASNYNESMYFNVFDGGAGVGGWFRMGNRVNEGHAELSACVYLPDGRVGFMFKRPEISSNDGFDAGGMRIDVVEPFERLTVSYDGRLCLLDNPFEMADPRRAFKDNPMVACELRIDYRGISPMHGGRPVRASDGAELPDDPNGFAKAHYEQMMAATGTLLVGEEAFAITAGLGIRDKSWGPRFWQSLYWYRWLPMVFSDDFGMTVTTIGAPDGTTRVGGWVFDGGEIRNVRSMSIESTYDEHGYQTSLTTTVGTSARDYAVRGEVASLIPLRNRRTTPDGDELLTRITEGMTRYRIDDREGVGLSEYLDQIVGGAAVGITAGG